VTELSHAVFLSYASQDQEAAGRICGALRGAGIEVWFDQNELRGGDAWDQKIRREIHDCALFIPIISANTAARQEGYFRLEWDLADQRTHRWPATGRSSCRFAWMRRPVRARMCRSRFIACSGHAYAAAIRLPHSSNG
jgi:hypothetical protein